MNAFLSVLNSCKDIDTDSVLKRTKLEILQVNMGNVCNQSCSHCHVDASPKGNKIMSKKVVDDIIGFLSTNKGLTLDITGGAPELNPHFDYFIRKTRPLVEKIVVRSNLTVFFEPGKEYLPEFFKENKIHLICSLPCYSEDNVDAQRGKGVFEKSIKALKLLNDIGYIKDKNLMLDIVYNPTGAYLPPQQEDLEKEYKKCLGGNYGIKFNHLFTITNAPIKRFKNYLESEGKYAMYLDILKDNFNPHIVENIMCRAFLSIGYDGKLYDCDFNQALGWTLKDDQGNILKVGEVTLKDLEKRNIMVGEHCLSCTAGYGSSCHGALTDEDQIASNNKETVKSYYGKVLKSTQDLKTSACCSIDSVSPSHKEIINKIDIEVRNKFYGCGSPIPPVLDNCIVLDLGCGTGRDVYLASFLVGGNGRVIGIDMTEEQLEVARKHVPYHTKEFGYQKPNVEFKKGYIENLKEIGIEDKSIDVVISNCVVNLSPDKKSVFKEIFRILKPGGELYFSDVFTGRRMPEDLKSDPVLYSECLGGALYIEDFRRILKEVGCLDYRVVSKRKIELKNEDIAIKAGMIDFYSMTIRAFKLNDLEDTCEDYGEIATYSGKIPNYPHKFALDEQHVFIAGKPMLVCGNTASMLQNTRYARYFKVTGNRAIHFGLFNCAPLSNKIDSESKNVGGACC